MKSLFTVIKFTINDMVKRKSFVISTIIILLMIVLGLNIPNIINMFSEEDESSYKLLIVDNDNVFEGNLSLLQNMNYDVEVKNYTFEELKDKINNDEISESLYIEKEDNDIKVKYLIKNVDFVSEVPEDLIDALSKLYTNIQINKLNISEEEKLAIFPVFDVSLEETGEESVNGNIFVMMMMSIILFYAIYFCAYQVSSSITTEKTSKIMETLVTSTSPSVIVLGKTIGIGIVGIFQMALILITAYITAKFSIDPVILESIFDMSNITLSLGLIILLYFILGYLIFSLLYALTGSTISKPEDIQSANSPVVILCMVSFYLSYFTMMNPASSLNTFASIFPFSSPFCMPFRVMMGLSGVSDIIISVVVLIISILIIARITIKIYSNAILNYGTKMSFKDIVNMYKDK